MVLETNIKNDCLDISGAKTKGTQLTIDKSYDKGLSIGENSNVNIKDLVMKNSRLGVAVKDGSIAYLENIESVNNDYDSENENTYTHIITPYHTTRNFPGLSDEEKLLKPMGGVEGFDETRIYSLRGRPYILESGVVQKYGLENKTDFEGLTDVDAFIIRRKRDNNNIPIDDSYKAQKVKIIEFKLTHMFKMCSVKCLTDSGEDECIISRLFYYP